MGYSQVFIDDDVEDPDLLQAVHFQLIKMGFDSIREVPTILALYLVTEGLDIYEELKQNLQLQVPFNIETATLSFMFRSIREEYDECFHLVDIQTTLRVRLEGDKLQYFEKSFGKSPSFPTKDQMIHESVDKAAHLMRAQAIKKGMDALRGVDVVRAMKKGP